MDVQDDDVVLIGRWFRRLQICIQTVDFVSSRSLFAEDMIISGTFTAFTFGREAGAVASCLRPYRPVPLAFR
jgi:hypothetical protein